MTDITKEAFEAFVSANCPAHVRDEPRVEMDSPYKYECFDNDDGDEVAFISWKDGVATYTIKDAA